MDQPGLNNHCEFTELYPICDPRWDEFVGSHPDSTIYHHSIWTRVLSETYGHTPFYLGLISSDDGHIKGVLPFLFINNFLTGKRMVSLPFTSYCNPLMPKNRLEEACRFAFHRHSGVKYVELKQLMRKNENEDNGQQGVESPYVCQILSLAKDINDLFLSFHESCIRRRVRHAEKNRLTFRLAETESELHRFYNMVVEVRQRQGLPPAPYKFFSNMYRLLVPMNLLEIPVIEFEGSVIAAALVLKSRYIWHLEYIASDARYNKLGPNQLLLWESIKRAHQSGAKHFDFGRTALWHHSLLEFKDRWRTERQRIHHHYFPDDAKTPQWSNLSNSFLAHLNKKMPSLFLRWEGRLIYPHKS